VNNTQKSAYATLSYTADSLRALITAARSSQHPLTMSDETVAAIVAAQQALHTAQRLMETER
jgi:hypothetical protein